MRRRPSVSDEALGEWSESDIWRPAWSAAKRPESTQLQKSDFAPVRDVNESFLKLSF